MDEKIWVELLKETRDLLVELFAKLLKESNQGIADLARSFNQSMIELNKQNLAHLKEMELKMMAGGAKEYVEANEMFSGDPNSFAKEDDGDWVDLVPGPLNAPSDLGSLKFGIQDTDGGVKVFGEDKRTKKESKKKSK